jgi:hypothetical protein
MWIQQRKKKGSKLKRAKEFHDVRIKIFEELGSYESSFIELIFP